MRINSFIIPTLVVPSYSIFQGVIGALPFGAVFLPFIIRGLSKYIFWYGVVFLITSAFYIKNVIGLAEALMYFVPLLIYQYFQNLPNIRSYRSPILLFLWVFFAEAILGSLVSESGIRSTVLITLEPSHSARAFFTFLFLYVAGLPPKSNILPVLLIAVTYVILNKSLSAFLMCVPFFFYKINLKIIIAVFLIVVGLTFDMPKRVSSQIDNVQQIYSRTTSFDQLDLLTLSIIGSRRFSQSVSGFGLSRWFSGVGPGNGKEELLSSSAGTMFDLVDVVEMNQLSDETAVGPSSYLSSLAYEYGAIFSLVVVLIILQALPPLSFYNRIWFLVGMVQLLLFSSSVFPTAWVILGVISHRRVARSL